MMSRVICIVSENSRIVLCCDPFVFMAIRLFSEHQIASNSHLHFYSPVMVAQLAQSPFLKKWGKKEEHNRIPPPLGPHSAAPLY